MMRHIYKIILILIIVTATGFTKTHPRLLFGPDDIPGLRERLDEEPFATMAERIEREASEATDRDDLYQHDHRMVNCGFMYILSGDSSWAKKAKKHVNTILNSGEWNRSDIKGLASYMHGKAVALAYDMCYNAWSPTYRSNVSDHLVPHADMINDHGGKYQNRSPASNWQGNRFSSAGLCYLATDTPFDTLRLNNCWQKLVTYCKENMGDDPQSRGWNIEGIGYTTYPFGNFIGAFGIAMAGFDSERDIRKTVESVRWLPWTVYANACRITNYNDYYGVHPDFGDDNSTVRGEGTMGLAFYYCYDELIPGLKYWYNRLVGAQGDGSYDYWRGGAIYGYLYYPDKVEEKNPMLFDKWLDGFIDTGGNGYMTYRNQYKDSTDMVAQFYVKRRGNKGHNGPDALSFRILGLDTPWAVGGGRYGPEINGHDAYLSSMNTLYPKDPESRDLDVNGNSGRIVGEPFLRPDGSGHVIANMRMNNVGTMGHKRWFVADYSKKAGCEAVYVIGDRSVNGVFWQICTLETQDITFDGENKTFRIEGAHGSSLKGWLLYNKGPHFFTKGTRIRGSNYGYKGKAYDKNNYLHFGSQNGDYLVVLTAATAEQQHPEPVVQGKWPNRVKVQIKDFIVTIDEDTISYGEPSSINNHSAKPRRLQLVELYPNPFNSRINIEVQLPESSKIDLSIFNALGQQVAQIYQGWMKNGCYSFFWNGRTERGKVLPSGLYLCQLQSGEQRIVKKVLYIR